MKLSDFDYELPLDRIAQYPLNKRSGSRLMVIDQDKGTIAHQHFYDLPQFLEAGDLLVFNDSRVIPARLFGRKPTGGKVEILIERILGEREVLAHVKASHLKVGAEIYLQLDPDECVALSGRQDGEHKFTVTAHEHLYHLALTSPFSLPEILAQYGHIPLPPYIVRADEHSDQERYQTVYAKEEGSVAAPTAGLHFDPELLAALHNKGIQFAYVTLHVGAGTFQPVKTENILDHTMHGEIISIPHATMDRIVATKKAGKRVITVGTTATRTLESAAAMPLPFAREKASEAWSTETKLFIVPGFHFKVTDAMITNFHLPKSSLLMLVAAFMGYDLMKEAYALAVKDHYRFFSFGDAMLIV